MDDQENKPTQPISVDQPDSSPVMPAAISEPVPTVPGAPAPQPKKKSIILGLIVAGVLIALGAAGVLTYNFWYQSPEKVITDGIVNAIKAKSVVYSGSLLISGDQEVKIEVSGRGKGTTNDLAAKLTFKQDEKTVTVDGAAIIDSKGDLYFKVKNIDMLVKNYSAALGDPQVQKLVDNLVAKVNDKWIKVSGDDLKSFSKDTAKGQSCLNEAVAKLESDDTITSELADTYKKHTFITINKSLGSKDGSLGYQLSSDMGVAKAFVKDLKATHVYKTLQSCDSSFKLDEEDMFKDATDCNKKDARVELWVSLWSHQITKLSLEETKDKNKATIVLEPKFNETVSETKAPEGATSLTQLKSDIEALIQSALDTEAEVLGEDMSNEL